MNISNEVSRTPIDIVQSLTWWYKYFLPSELNFLFYLHCHWYNFDPLRDVNIANKFREKLRTTHTNPIIQSLLAYFRSHPEVLLIQRTIIDNDQVFCTNILQLIPFTDICVLCHQKLSAANSRSRQVRVICDQGKTLIGDLYIFFLFTVT